MRSTDVTSDAAALAGSTSEASREGRVWDQLLALRAIDNKRAQLNAIDQALGRMADKTYGFCVVHHAQLPKDLLRDRPWATHCSKCMSFE